MIRQKCFVEEIVFFSTRSICSLFSKFLSSLSFFSFFHEASLTVPMIFVLKEKITSDRRQAAAEVDQGQQGCQCLPRTSSHLEHQPRRWQAPREGLSLGCLQVQEEQDLSVPSLHHGVAGPGGQLAGRIAGPDSPQLGRGPGL